MQGFITFALYLVPSFLVICVLSLGGLCVAQEVDAPGGEGGPGSVFLPSGYLELIVPLQERIDLELYGFYIGGVDVPVAQIDVPIRTTRFLTITPSYMYYAVPPSGLNKLAPQPGGFTRTYDEHQFRIAGTFKFSIRKLEISDRNMYVRRFRQAALGDLNRYRHRIHFAHPVAVKGHTWKPFTSYEAFYEWRNGGWNRNRVWVGVTLPLKERHVWFQPSYLWETAQGQRDSNYLMFALIFRTK